jgi:hypothetical protein
MTHSSEISKGFAAHFLGLLKNTGTSGTTGPTPAKAFNSGDKTGTAGKPQAVPVSGEWYQAAPVTGTGKDKVNQYVGGPGTGGTSGTTVLEQGPDEPESGGSPVKWHAILAELERMDCPERLAPDRWRDVLSDAETFLSRWGSAAHSLGWTALDLFGVHPSAPGRVDVMGLLLLIQGGVVLALTADAATIRRQTGAVLTYRRPELPGAVLISAVQS